MSKPLPQNYPLEIFGHNTELTISESSPLIKVRDENDQDPYKEIPCPFKSSLSPLFGEEGAYCDKIRKQRPNPLIGNCSLRKTNRDDSHSDWIVCPHRFLEDKTIFNDCKKFLKKGSEYILGKEVKIADQGNADFVLTSRNNLNQIVDFVSIEIQGIGTSNTGDIWDARNDFLNGKMKKNYGFGINQKMSSKTILVQILHKAEQLNKLQKKTILIIQDYFYKHLLSTYNIKENFKSQKIKDPIHIHSYKLVKNKGDYKIKLDKQVSTDLIGMHKAIKGKGTQVLEKKSIIDAMEKRIGDGVFHKI